MESCEELLREKRRTMAREGYFSLLLILFFFPPDNFLNSQFHKMEQILGYLLIAILALLMC